MGRCPAGHATEAQDYCDVCGVRMGALSSAARGAPPGAQRVQQQAPPAAASGAAGGGAGSTAAAQSCPACGTPRTGRFCEECGRDLSLADETQPDAQRPVPQQQAQSAPQQFQPAPQPGPHQQSRQGRQGGARSVPDHAPDGRRPGPGTPPHGPAPANPAPAAPEAPPAPPPVPPDQQGSAAPQRSAPVSSTPVSGGTGLSRPSVPGLWRAVISADPAFFQSMADRGMLDPNSIDFPAQAPRRHVPLNRPEVHIGRRSHRRGIQPEIDLGGPPEDVAVSHRHAVLLARPGGAWVLVDLGATNGTSINGADEPIDPHREYPVHDGDRIYLGAWTVITLQRG